MHCAKIRETLGLTAAALVGLGTVVAAPTAVAVAVYDTDLEVVLTLNTVGTGGQVQANDGNSRVSEAPPGVGASKNYTLQLNGADLTTTPTSVAPGDEILLETTVSDSVHAGFSEAFALADSVLTLSNSTSGDLLFTFGYQFVGNASLSGAVSGTPFVDPNYVLSFFEVYDESFATELVRDVVDAGNVSISGSFSITVPANTPAATYYAYVGSAGRAVPVVSPVVLLGSGLFLFGALRRKSA